MSSGITESNLRTTSRDMCVTAAVSFNADPPDPRDRQRGSLENHWVFPTGGVALSHYLTPAAPYSSTY